jgi:hypothetical protein
VYCLNRVELGPKTESATLATMTRLLKKYLLWLLIAVLPIQGFAAVVQRSCNSGRMVAASAALETAELGPSAYDIDAVSASEQAVSKHDGCAEHTVDLSKERSGSHTYKHGSCSACASCCVGAVAPPVFSSFSLPSKIPEVRRPSGATPVIGFIPDSLERPPRHPAA